MSGTYTYMSRKVLYYFLVPFYILAGLKMRKIQTPTQTYNDVKEAKNKSEVEV